MFFLVPFPKCYQIFSKIERYNYGTVTRAINFTLFTPLLALPSIARTCFATIPCSLTNSALFILD